MRDDNLAQKSPNKAAFRLTVSISAPARTRKRGAADLCLPAQELTRLETSPILLEDGIDRVVLHTHTQGWVSQTCHHERVRVLGRSAKSGERGVAERE